MKINKFLPIAFALLLGTILNSCQKDDTGPGASAGARISKVTFWNSSTGVESAYIDVVYDGTRIKSVKKQGYEYTPTFDASGRVTAIAGLQSPLNYKADYVFEYNASGALTKAVLTNTNPGPPSSTNIITSVYEYNAAGKIIKQTNSFSNQTYIHIYDYVWTGDNMTEETLSAKLASGVISPGTPKKYKYDDKVNPFYVSGTIFQSIQGPDMRPVSKNNRIDENGQVQTFEYNSAGYPVSSKFTAAEGMKYYYVN